MPRSGDSWTGSCSGRGDLRTDSAAEPSPKIRVAPLIRSWRAENSSVSDCVARFCWRATASVANVLALQAHACTAASTIAAALGGCTRCLRGAQRNLICEGMDSEDKVTFEDKSETARTMTAIEGAMLAFVRVSANLITEKDGSRPGADGHIDSRLACRCSGSESQSG